MYHSNFSAQLYFITRIILYMLIYGTFQTFETSTNSAEVESKIPPANSSTSKIGEAGPKFHELTHPLKSMIKLYPDTWPDVRQLDNRNELGLSVVPEENGKEDRIFLRRKRSTGIILTSADKDAAVNKHNELRRLEGASNMEKMKWNDRLAEMAAAWAAGCVFDHGQPVRDKGYVPFENIGQNLYAIQGAQSIDVSRAIQSWYNEKIDYNYDTLVCKPGKKCGHYTQVVWGTSIEVGCAYAFCSELKIANYHAAFHLVCNYGPGGNLVSQKPYLLGGPACSKCNSGHGWCENGLCQSDCQNPGPNCKCPLVCQNCGTLDPQTCSCRCADGWYGPSCTDVCKNHDARCGANPGFPAWYCNHVKYQKTIKAACPVLCGRCVETKELLSCGKPVGRATSTNYSLALIFFSFLTRLLI